MKNWRRKILKYIIFYKSIGLVFEPFQEESQCKMSLIFITTENFENLPRLFWSKMSLIFITRGNFENLPRLFWSKMSLIFITRGNFENLPRLFWSKL